MDKQNMHDRPNWSILAFVLLILTGCNQEPSSGYKVTSINESDDINIIAVNSEEFMFNAQEQGGDITFKTPDFDNCRLSFIKSRMKSGYHTRTEKFGEGEVDLSCLTDNKLYAMSPISPTFIDMTVTETDGKDISIKLVSTLFSTRTRETLENIQMELVVDGDRLGHN